MNRRAMLKSVFAAAAGSSAIAAVHSQGRKIGFLDVHGHLAHKRVTGEDLHVFLDGVDVTRKTFEADDVEGYVRLFCTDEVEHTNWNAKGAKHIARDGGGACRLEVRGRVEFRA